MLCTVFFSSSKNFLLFLFVIYKYIHRYCAEKCYLLTNRYCDSLVPDLETSCVKTF